MQKITIGHDVEFVVSSFPEGKVVPVCGLAGGTKELPIYVGDDIGTTYQEDGMCLELGMNPVEVGVTTDDTLVAVDTFMNNLFQSVETVYGLLPNLEITELGGIEVSEMEVPFEALKIGCDPDKDAYRNGLNRRAFNNSAFFSGLCSTTGAPSTRRFAGGHLHFGYSNDAGTPKWALVKLLDIYALLYSEGFTDAVAQDHQSGPTRYQFYGRPGLYRDKPYGIEYRSPSNFWAVKEDERFVYDCVRTVQAVTALPRKDVKAWLEQLPMNEFEQTFVTTPSAITFETLLAFRQKYNYLFRNLGIQYGLGDLSWYNRAISEEEPVCLAA